MKSLSQFIKRHPWLLAKCIAFTLLVSNILAFCLKRIMVFSLNLQGLRANHCPPSIEYNSGNLQGKSLEQNWAAASPKRHPIVCLRTPSTPFSRDSDGDLTEEEIEAFRSGSTSVGTTVWSNNEDNKVDEDKK